MLKLVIPDKEIYDERTNEFFNIKGATLQLEHSLVSLSKWESKWCKPFLSKKDKTTEELLDYIKCMTLTQNVNPDLYKYLSNATVNQINEYINAPMTATTFYEEKGGKKSSEQVTSELIYYWMVALNIPFECQKWHLNRLLTLIKVCNIKNQPPKKRSKKDIAAHYARINAERKKQLNTRG